MPKRSMLPLWRSIHDQFLKRGQRWGLPANACMTLVRLHIHPEHDEPALLSEATHYPRQTMTLVLDTLESKGLATRLPHPSDRRRKRVVLTRAGRALGSRIFQDLLAFESVALAAIPKGKLEAFRTLVECYADALDRQNRTGSVPH